MKFIFDKDSWQEIFGSIRKNKLRTSITVIGVLWGIFLFVTLLGAARGMENGFDKEFKNLATNSIFLWGDKTSIPYKGFQRGKRIRLKTNDVEAIKKHVKNIEFVVPRCSKGVWNGRPAHVKRKTNFKVYKVFGDYPIVDKVSKVKLLKGRFLNLTDINENKKVCVVGERIVDELFENEKLDNVVGEFIEVDGMYFKIIGVYKEKRQGFEDDDSIYMPFSTFRQLYNLGDDIHWLVIAAKQTADIKTVENDIKALLRRRKNTHPDDKQAFGSFNFGEVYNKITGFVKGLKFLTWFVGIATLISGIIAIGSILLITVKERTQEIGIRRAIGATPSKIRGQIVLESVFLTLISGILGIIFGGLVLMILNVVAEQSDDFPFVNPSISIPIALGAVLTLVVFGSLIGMIPAQIAVSIKPIEALSDE